MTKERRLAVQMWREIAIKFRVGIYIPNIQRTKEIFCERHKLNWLYNCWFCQYISRSIGILRITNCSRCPLGTCSLKTNSHWSRLMKGSREERAIAADEIADILENKR